MNVVIQMKTLIFQFEVKPHGFYSFDLELQIPVTIGNITLDPSPFNKPPETHFSGSKIPYSIFKINFST
jgi:hypothetical protein